MLLITCKTIKVKRKSLESCEGYLAICIPRKGGKYKFSLSRRAIKNNITEAFYMYISTQSVLEATKIPRQLIYT